MNKFAFPLIIILLAGVLPAVDLNGQQKDFQFWPSVTLNLEVINKLKIHVEEEIRFNENSSMINRQVNDIGASYRLNKHLKAGIFYRLEADWKNVDEYSWRNGIYSDVALRYGLERFTIGYRLRLQSSKVEQNDKETDLFDGFRHRHKLSASYDVKGFPLVPFFESELFIDYSSGKSGIRGLRTWIGMDYTIKKIHTISLKYGIDQELNMADPIQAYILAVGYAIDLSMKHQSNE